jgi:hypothetical protein
MKYPIKLILLLVAAVLFCAASSAEARGHGSLSARAAKNHKGVKFVKGCHSYRVNDCGKPLKSWNKQVVYRATNDTFVYRSQNQATVRHDEVSSHAIMFNLKGGKIRPGHIYQTRGN